MSNVYQDYKVPASEGGLYHKFEDGVTYVVRLASEPIVYQTEFQSPTGEVNISTKYAWVVWNVEDKVARIMQLPVIAYRQIAALATDDEYGDPRNYNLKITRTGKAVETKYAVVASPKQSKLSDLDENAEAEVDKVDLIDKVSAGKGVSNVNWLSDLIDGDKKPSLSKKDQAEHDAVVREAIGRDKEESPVDLSEIPF